MTTKNLKILFFSPFQFIEPHTYPEALFAKCLHEAGHSVSLMGCGTLLRQHCVAHSSVALKENALTEDKFEICRQCCVKREAMKNHFSESFLLEDFYDSKRETEIQGILASLTPTSIYGLSFRGYPIGRLASYEFLVHYKISDINTLTSEQLGFFKISLGNTARILISFENFLKDRRIDRIFCYNSNYAANGIMRAVASQKNIPVLSMHAGLNLGRLNNTALLTHKRFPDFLRKLPIDYAENPLDGSIDYSKYHLILDHMRELLRGNSFFVYSAGKSRTQADLYSKLGLGEGKYEKTILLTTSSLDEVYAEDFAIVGLDRIRATESAFPDQIDWIRNVVEYFRGLPQYKLILRIHPREFPNKREGQIGQRVKEYEKIFQSLPSNIVVNRPEQNISIYDLYEAIDLHLMSISSTGNETALLGIPGLGYSTESALYPVAYVNEVARVKSDYFRRISEFLQQENEDVIPRMKRAFLWNIFLFDNANLKFNVGDFWRQAQKNTFFRKALRKSRTWMGMPRYRIASYLSCADFDPEERNVFLRMVEQSKELIETRMLSSPSNSPMAGKEQFFLRYLRDLIQVYYGIEIPPYAKLEFSAGNPQMEPNPNECLFVVDPMLMQLEVLHANAGTLIRIPGTFKSLQRMARAFVELSKRTLTRLPRAPESPPAQI